MKHCITLILCISIVSGVNHTYAAISYDRATGLQRCVDSLRNLQKNHQLLANSYVQGGVAFALGLGFGYYMYQISHPKICALQEPLICAPPQKPLRRVPIPPRISRDIPRPINALISKGYGISQKPIAEAWPQKLMTFVREHEVDDTLRGQLNEIMVGQRLLDFLSFAYMGYVDKQHSPQEQIVFDEDGYARRTPFINMLNTVYGLDFLPAVGDNLRIFTLKAFPQYVFKIPVFTGDNLSVIHGVVGRVYRAEKLRQKAVDCTVNGKTYQFIIPKKSIYLCPGAQFGERSLLKPPCIAVVEKCNTVGAKHFFSDDQSELFKKIVEITEMWDVGCYDYRYRHAANVWIRDQAIIIVDTKSRKDNEDEAEFRDVVGMPWYNDWNDVLDRLHGHAKVKQEDGSIKDGPATLPSRFITPCGLIAYKGSENSPESVES